MKIKESLIITAQITVIALFMLIALGSATQQRIPTTFQRGAGGETAILLREGLDFDMALREIIFVLNRHGFEPEFINSDVGYIRTRWNFTWNDTGTHIEVYRVRITTNFNPARTQLILRAEAEHRQGRGGGTWVRGFDTRAIETLRNDLTMVIGN